MDITLVNLTSVTNATLTFIGLFIIKELIVWIRYTVPKSVQCWFCHAKTQVPYKLSNCWYCPSCEQYNGFDKDGGYNRELEKQYDEYLNATVTTQGRCKNGWKPGNTLCKTCNHNQELKVKLLAAFVPLNEKRYDIEIDHYKQQLDKCYKLCQKCDKLLYTIFKNEREDFSVPRKLVASPRKIQMPGKTPVVFNLLLSICLAISAYTQLIGVPGLSWPSQLDAISKYLKESAPILNQTLNFTPSWIPVIFNQNDFLLAAGLFTNIVGVYRTHSQLLFLNCISWTINFFLNKFPLDMQNWVFAVEAVSGVLSCLLSVHILFKINTKRVKSKVEPRASGTIFSGAAAVTSTPNCTPESFSKSEDQNSFTKNISKTPYNKTVVEPLINKSWKKEDSLEPRIRGLNITETPYNNSKLDSINSSFHTFGDDFLASSTNPGTWGMTSSAGMANSIYSGLSQGSKNTHIKRRKNIVSPTRFITDPVRPTSAFSAASPAPSVIESSRSNHTRDIDAFSNPPDDCMSCSGHSHCRHFTSYPPPPYPMAYYYPPQYQSMYQPPLSPYKPSQSANEGSLNQLSHFYTIAIGFLVFCNLGLITTIYSKNLFTVS